MERATIYTKNGSKWEECRTITDKAEVLEDLMKAMRAKYLHKAGWVKKITDRTNYDGTRTITVYYDNQTKAVFIVAD